MRHTGRRNNGHLRAMIGTACHRFGGRIARALKALARARHGNVAIMFALALVPLTVAGGMGLDYARGMMVRDAMSDALDAASLAVGSSTGLDHDSALALAQKYFDANYKLNGDAYGTVALSMADNGYNSANGSVTITATDTMPTAIMRLAGIKTMPITTSTTVVWGQSKLWVALVLDNSGSMREGDDGQTKMEALQNASKQLLTVLQNASANPGDVQVSIVPFDRTVNVGTSNVDASWIGWTRWEAQPAGVDLDGKTDLIGPGDPCPFNSYNDGYTCVTTPAGSHTTSTIPDGSGWGYGSEDYAGYICPGIDSGRVNTDRYDEYYNGCYTSVATGDRKTVSTGSGATCRNSGYANCKCEVKKGNKVCSTPYYKHQWVVNSHSTWDGCVEDRDQDYDISTALPGVGGTPFPAAQVNNCLGATITTLGYDWDALSTEIDNMRPNDSTNQAIGVVQGWQTLTPGAPYGAPAVPENTARYIILFSDGLNTRDRWWGDGRTEGTTEDGYIDDRQKKACAAAKADGVIIYSVFLDIGGKDGTSDPLSSCASDSSKYFHLTDSDAVVTTFNQIAAQITNVRVSR